MSRWTRARQRDQEMANSIIREHSKVMSELMGKLRRIKEYTDPLDGEVARTVNGMASE